MNRPPHQYLNDEGKVTVYLVGGEGKRLVLDYLASKFDYDRGYSEASVEAVLNAWHTFGQAARLRRDLLEANHLSMRSDATLYWKVHSERSV